MVEVGQEGQKVRGWRAGLIVGIAHDLKLGAQHLHASDFGDGDPGKDDDHGHLERELKEIGDQASPESSDEGVNAGEGNQHQYADEQGSVARIAEGQLPKHVAADRELQDAAGGDHGTEEDGDDVCHSIGDPAEDETVHQQSEVEGLEAAQKSGGLAAVANLGQLDVGKNLGAAPVAGKEKDGEHAAEAHAPPDPVAGDSLGGDDAGDQQRSISRESRGHHRGTGQPPGDVAARDEKIFGVAGGAPAVIKTDEQVDDKVAGDDEPVDVSQGHVRESRWRKL